MYHGVYFPSLWCACAPKVPTRYPKKYVPELKENCAIVLGSRYSFAKSIENGIDVDSAYGFFKH